VKGKKGTMTKKLYNLPIFFLLLVTLHACSPSPASLPPATQTSLEFTATPRPQVTSQAAAALTNAPDMNNLPQSLTLVSLPGAYQFTEGPAVDANGNIYFSDINAGIIYRWSTDGSVSVFLEGLNHPNGLMFDKSGSLVACEGGAGRLISIDPQKNITVLADKYDGTRFNEPNDLWIDPQGGIYFTDPAYQSPVLQDGQHVYYLSPDRSQVTRVIIDMNQPNGLVGTPDGRTLYVADFGAGQTFTYTINSDGSLWDKRLFTATGSDGMDLDKNGNLYLTSGNQVKIFDSAGNLLHSIPMAENPTNVAFAGADGGILFITARTQAYTAQLSASSAVTVPQASGFTLTSPDLPADGRLSAEYTCDGAASTLALSWSGAPAGTKSFAVIMHHNAPDNAIHWYWVLYNLPANVTSLSKNITGVGTLGANSVNDKNAYTPPCSKGPGDKEYIYTVYALSAEPPIAVTASKVDRSTLLGAIKDITIASTELHVVYARP
jgi:gluconolactonase